MDDEHTKQALDDLADLFLTGVKPDSGGPAPRQRDNPLDAPPPIRLKPKLTGPDRDETPPGANTDEEILQAVTGSKRSEHQAAAEAPFLRLAGDDKHPPQPQQPAPPPAPGPATAMLEAVLLGNLPGVSGPWLQQYAQLLADQAGSVVVLHVGDDRVDVELIEPAAAPGALRPVIQMGHKGRPALVALLDALVRDAEHPAATVLIHVEPAVDGSEALRLFAIDDWTLLCGADDASVVGAYRMLKERAEVDVTVRDKRIGLMVMGADEDASRAAAARIRATADSFLHAPVELVGWQKQMIPVHARQLGSFDDLTRLWPRLCDWFTTLQPPAVERIEAPAETKPPKPTAQPPAEEAPRRRPQPRPQPQRPARTEAPPSHAELRPPRRAAATERPQHQPVAAIQEPTTSNQQPTTRTPPALAALIETLPGAVALEARCPQLPDTEIVLDQQGALHLLHRAGDNVERAVTDLMVARQWVIEHRDLLALTQRQLKLDPAAPVHMHLFTQRADLSTRLVARLGDQLKLHLLRSVAVGDQSAWVCAALN